jgi:putative ABC transport system permease protein
VLLALLGGGLGVVLAFWSLSLLRGFLPTDIPRLHQVQLDWQILGYTLGLSLLTGILFGLAPAVLASRAKPSDPLKEGSRNAGSRRSTGRYLLVSEVALATILLIGAGLLVRSVYGLTRVDPGFRADNLLTMQIALPDSRYGDENLPMFLDQMQERMGTLPGVISATVGASFPMIDWNWSSIFILDDRPVPPREKLPSSIFNPVDTNYFETFGIPLIRGRTFQDSDNTHSPSVIVVNQTLADRHWPNENPIGKRLKQGWPECEGERCPWREIVGVVGNTKHLGLDDENRSHTYIPLKQSPELWVRVALRSAQDPMLLAQPAKAVVASMDPDLPVYEIQPMETIIESSMAPRWFTMLLLGIFAVLALILAAIGLYGVIAYSVARRTQEIGLRMAVGAKRVDIFRLVIRQGLGLSLVGSLLGIAGALALSQLLSSLLYGVTPRDLLTFSAVPIVLTLVAFTACSAPAFSATRVDPIVALRYE